MQWVVDKIPEQALLNTARWRFIIPQLYKKYPNQDMSLNISLSSPPRVKISEQYVGANVNADLVINVLDASQVIPVACISLVSPPMTMLYKQICSDVSLPTDDSLFPWLQMIRGSGALRVMGNNLGGSVSLEDFSMSLKWSNIGNLHLHLLQVKPSCQVFKALPCLFQRKFHSFLTSTCVSLSCSDLLANSVDCYTNSVCAICK